MNTKWFTIEELQQLEKNCKVDFRYCDIIADAQNNDENIRETILKDENSRYFYQKMQNGNIIDCFEIALNNPLRLALPLGFLRLSLCIRPEILGYRYHLHRLFCFAVYIT